MSPYKLFSYQRLEAVHNPVIKVAHRKESRRQRNKWSSPSTRTRHSKAISPLNLVPAHMIIVPPDAPAEGINSKLSKILGQNFLI